MHNEEKLLRFLYTAWFRDEIANCEDQDHEWPACFIVEANTASDAQAWGDHLARAFGKRHETESFLRSSVENVPLKSVGLPFIKYGYEADDKEIGW